MKAKILVIGSSNTDMVVQAAHLPSPGETILGGTFFMNAGGKGANQAVAAARLGGDVTFICKVGNDVFGKQAVSQLQQEGIDISYHLTDPDAPSGVALITVDKQAENCIVVASGANATLRPSDLDQAADVISGSSFLLTQLETPLETIEYLAELAHKKGLKVILNPAPACVLSDALLSHVHIITPNQKEAAMISNLAVTDLPSAEKAARYLQARGVQTVIITMGSAGAFVLSENETRHIAAHKVEAVDTTAAGDVFNGSLVVALANGQDIFAATEFACMASAISVTRLGAQASAPRQADIDAFQAQLPQ